MTTKTLRNILTLTMLLTYILIVIGAAVRVTDSGMSCPDWPMCYGKAFPFPVSFEETGYTNTQVFLEWVHRLIASILGFLIIISAVFSLRLKESQKAIKYLAVLTIITLVSQVILGKITVNLENINWSVALHLGNAMIIFGLITAWRRLVAAHGETTQKIETTTKQKALLWVITVFVFGTMLLGAMVSSSHAGGICGGLFSCDGKWMPSGDIDQLLHMKHRYMALVTFLLIVFFFVSSKKANTDVRQTAKGLKILVSGQVALGIITLYSFSHYAWGYQALSVFHLAWGTLLFMACIGGLTKFYFGKGGAFHGKHT